MHSVFLYHAIRAGMDMGIVNPGMLQGYDEIPRDLLALVEDVILNRREDATERLISHAESLQDTQKKTKDKADEWRKASLEERLNHALVKGITDHIEKDVLEAREIDCIRVVGRREPVTVYQLLGRKGELSDEAQARLELYGRALQEYKEKKWEEASSLFRDLDDDPVVSVYLGRIEVLKNDPPDEDWDGVFELKEK